MSEQKKLTSNVGAPDANNQNVMTAGSRFCVQTLVQCSLNDPSNLPLSRESIDKTAKVN
jgi:hypothetical protein